MQLAGRSNVFFNEDLHLGVSMRSFRAEQVSELVKLVLDQEEMAAAKIGKARYGALSYRHHTGPRQGQAVA